MSNLHPATQLLLVTALFVFWLIPLTAWWMLRSRRDHKASLWFLGTTWYAVAGTILALQGGAPSPLAWLAMFWLVSVSALPMIESLRQETDSGPAPVPRYLALLTTIWAAIFIPLMLFDNEALARGFFLGSLLLLHGWVIRLALRARRTWNSRALDVVILSFAAFMLISLARLATWLLSGESRMILSLTTLSNIAVIANFLGVILQSFGYWGFVTEKSHRLEKQAAQQALEAHLREHATLEREQLADKAAAEREALLKRILRLGRMAQAGALTASIAHEINQPLASIRLNIESALALLERAPANPPLQALLQKAGRENLRAARIIEHLRTLFGNGQSRPQLRSIDELARRVLTLVEDRTRLEGLGLQTAFDAPRPIAIVEGEIENVILNLLNNAVDAVQACPATARRIAISTSQQDDRTCLSITDSGAGVAPADRPHLFELMFSTKPQGMGMGLWLARHIVERHRGRLYLADSTGPGARFVLELPSQADPTPDILRSSD
jgi:signal transduction histidine kinase